MTGRRALCRLEKKFTTLRQQQEAMQLQMKKVRKDIEAERMARIVYLIKKTGFPADKPAILIGAILSAKEKLESTACVEELNRYIDLYNVFAGNHPGIEQAAEQAMQEEPQDPDGEKETAYGE